MARPKGHKLDRIDLMLIRELAKGKELPLVKLAKKAGISYSPCRRRVERLFGGKYVVMKGVISEERSRWTHVRLVILTLAVNNKSAMNRFVAAIQTIPNVLCCDAVAGSWDFLLRVATRNAEEFEEVRHQVVGIVPGSRTQTLEVIKVAKHYALPPEALFDALPEA